MGDEITESSQVPSSDSAFPANSNSPSTLDQESLTQDYEAKECWQFEDLFGICNVLVEGGQMGIGMVLAETNGKGVNIFTCVCALLSLASILFGWMEYAKAAKAENCVKIHPWLPIYRYQRDGSLYLNFPRGLSISMSILRFSLSITELVQRLKEKDPNVPTASFSLVIAVAEGCHGILLRHYLTNHLYVRCLHARRDYIAVGKRIGDRSYLIACTCCCQLNHPRLHDSNVHNFVFPNDDFFRTQVSKQRVLNKYNIANSVPV